MVKIQVNSQGKAYYTSAGKVLLAPETGNTITATNNTGSAVSEGDKVWIEPSGSNYNLINFSLTPVYDNFTIVGSPTITSAGIVSGFSSSNYLTIHDNPNFQDANSWEFITRVSVDSIYTSQKLLFGYGINFGVISGYLHLWLYNNGSLFIDSNICSASLLSTKPFIKLSFDGTIYSCYISPDGETWTLQYSYKSTTKTIDNGPFTLGKDGYGGSEYWRGSIDLSQTYIKIDDKIWWVPKKIQINESTLTGFAQENIASGASGNVKTVLGD